MKITLVSPFPETPEHIVGGVAGASKYLADELVKLPGLSVCVVVPQGSRSARVEREQWDGGLCVYRLPKTGTWRRMPGTVYDLLKGNGQVERQLERLAPDIVHFQGTSFLAAASERRCVLTIHGVAEKDAAWDRRRGLAARWLKRGLLRVTEGYGRRAAPNVILISEAIRAFLPNRDARRVWRIPNPIADSFFEVAPSPEPGRVFSCTRVTPLKNVLGLIEAFALAAARVPGAQLRVAGAAERPYLDACRERARALGVESAVHFLGSLSVPEVQEELSRAACFALASFQENAPLSLAEAMAAGVPAVAARVGGVPEMVEDGATGLLVDSRDSEGFAKALVEVLSDPKRAAAMGRRAKQAAGARHRASEVARRTAEVYREIAGLS